MFTGFFDRIIRALTPHPRPLNSDPPVYPARSRTARPPVQFFKVPLPSLDQGTSSSSFTFETPSSSSSSSSSFGFGIPPSHRRRAPALSFDFGTPLPSHYCKAPPSSFNSGTPLPLKFIPSVFGHNPTANCALVLSSGSPFVPQTTDALPTSPSAPPVASPDFSFPSDFSSPSDPPVVPPNFTPPFDFSSPPDSSSPDPPPVVLPRPPSSNAFVGYGTDGSPFLLFSHLSNPPPHIPGRLPPPSFAFGPTANPEKMGEPKPPTTRSSSAASRAAAEDDKNGSSSSEIPYFKLHATHLSTLRGQIRYLEILNRKKGCEGKLDKMIAGYAQIVKDAKVAAATAGIVREDPKPTEKRKTRPSVSFAEEDEIFVSPIHKRTKAKPAPPTILKSRRGNAGKRKPTSEALATLRSCLGKRNRSNTETTPEDEEEDAPQKPFKRPRPRIFQEGDPLGKYVGDPDTEDEDSDSDSFKSAASKPEPTPATGNTAGATSPPVTDTKAAKATSVPSTTNSASSVPTAEASEHRPPVPQAKHAADDKPAAEKSAKKQRQASVSKDIETDAASSADCLFAIRPPPSGKHTVDGHEKSAKKQKQRSTPEASTGNASASAAPAATAQTPTKRNASGAGVSEPSTKRSKK